MCRNKTFDVAQKVIWCRQKQVDIERKSVSCQQRKVDVAQKKYLMSTNARYLVLKEVINFLRNGATQNPVVFSLGKFLLVRVTKFLIILLK